MGMVFELHRYCMVLEAGDIWKKPASSNSIRETKQHLVQCSAFNEVYSQLSLYRTAVPVIFYLPPIKWITTSHSGKVPISSSEAEFNTRAVYFPLTFSPPDSKGLHQQAGPELSNDLPSTNLLNSQDKVYVQWRENILFSRMYFPSWMQIFLLNWLLHSVNEAAFPWTFDENQNWAWILEWTEWSNSTHIIYCI